MASSFVNECIIECCYTSGSRSWFEHGLKKNTLKNKCVRPVPTWMECGLRSFIFTSYWIAWIATSSRS